MNVGLILKLSSIVMQNKRKSGQWDTRLLLFIQIVSNESKKINTTFYVPEIVIRKLLN